MDNSNVKTEFFVPIGQGNVDYLAVHIVRILIKCGIVAAMYFTQSPYLFPISIYIIFSEIFDQIIIYVIRKNPSFKEKGGILYVLNSISLISILMYFNNWVFSDFFLIYLIHISSALFAYGWKTGILSFLLASGIYSSLLYINQASLSYYMRIIILSLIVVRLFLIHKKYETVNLFLKNILNVEKSKQDFIGIASHNLRTPVAAIYGYIELLLRDASNFTEQQVTFIKRIRNNNQELEKLTEDLLQISLFEIGKEVNLLKQASQIEVIIEDVIEEYKDLANSKNLKIIFDKQERLLPLVNIDVEKIKGVISNLVDNAIKYTESGRVTISLKADDNFVSIAVIDTGVGISKEDLYKVFTKFFRSGNILVYNKKGVGLGLYLGKQIVERHGGKISVESEEKKGTNFTITLPIMKEALE